MKLQRTFLVISAILLLALHLNNLNTTTTTAPQILPRCLGCNKTLTPSYDGSYPVCANVSGEDVCSIVPYNPIIVGGRPEPCLDGFRPMQDPDRIWWCIPTGASPYAQLESGCTQSDGLWNRTTYTCTCQTQDQTFLLHPELPAAISRSDTEYTESCLQLSDAKCQIVNPCSGTGVQVVDGRGWQVADVRYIKKDKADFGTCYSYYSCICKTGYTGRYCDTPPGPPSPGPAPPTPPSPEPNPPYTDCTITPLQNNQIISIRTTGDSVAIVIGLDNSDPQIYWSTMAYSSPLKFIALTVNTPDANTFVLLEPKTKKLFACYTDAPNPRCILTDANTGLDKLGYLPGYGYGLNALWYLKSSPTAEKVSYCHMVSYPQRTVVIGPTGPGSIPITKQEDSYVVQDGNWFGVQSSISGQPASYIETAVYGKSSEDLTYCYDLNTNVPECAGAWDSFSYCCKMLDQASACNSNKYTFRPFPASRKRSLQVGDLTYTMCKGAKMNV